MIEIKKYMRNRYVDGSMGIVTECEYLFVIGDQQRTLNIDEALINQIEVSWFSSARLSHLPSQCWCNRQINRATVMTGIESVHKSNGMGSYSPDLIELLLLLNIQSANNRNQWCTFNMSPSFEDTKAYW